MGLSLWCPQQKNFTKSKLLQHSHIAGLQSPCTTDCKLHHTFTILSEDCAFQSHHIARYFTIFYYLNRMFHHILSSQQDVPEWNMLQLLQFDCDFRAKSKPFLSFVALVFNSQPFVGGSRLFSSSWISSVTLIIFVLFLSPRL